MTVQFALFLSSEGIALAHRQTAGHWAFLGDTTLESPTLEADLAALRASAEARVDGPVQALLVLPDDQLLYTSLTAPTDDRDLTIYRIEDGLDGLTPYSVPELAYDWRIFEQDRVKLAVVARETLDEARGFASAHGIQAVGFAAMPPLERFPGVPVFEVEDEAGDLGLGDDGLAFGPDDWADGDSAAEVDEAPEEPTVAETDEDAGLEPEAEADAALVEDDVEEDASDADDAGWLDAADAPEEAAYESDAEPEDDSPAMPATPEEPAPADMSDDEGLVRISDPMLETPIAPIETEETAASDEVTADAPEPEPETAPEEPRAPEPIPAEIDDSDDDLPPMPPRAILEARRKSASAARSATPGKTTPPLTARKPPSRDPEVAPGALVGERRSRIGFGRAAPEEGKPLHPDAAEPPRKEPTGADPKNAFARQLERVRDASKARPRPATPPGTAARPATRGGTAAMPGIESEAAQRADRALSGLGKPDTGRKPEKRKTERKSGSARGAAMSGAAVSALGQMGSRLTGLVSGARAKASDATGKARSGLRTRRKAEDGAAPRPAEPPVSGDAPARGRKPAKPPASAPAPAATTGSRPGRLGGMLRGGAGGTAASGAAADAPAASRELQSGFLANRTNAASGAGSDTLRTGLIMTVVLLIVLALIAIGSAVFLPNSPVARLLFGGSDTDVALRDTTPPEAITAPPAIGMVTTAPADQAPAARPAPEIVIARPQQAPTPDSPADAAAGLETDGDAALPPLPAPTDDNLPSLSEAQRLYDADGIWARTPLRPDLPGFELRDTPPVAALDPELDAFDAFALPGPGQNPDALPRRRPPPLPFGAEIDLDERGLVVPTPEGVRTPAGAFVIAGTPPVTPQPRPREIAPPPPVGGIEDAILGTIQPTPRPGDRTDLGAPQPPVGQGATEQAAISATTPLSAEEVAARASLFPETPDSGLLQQTAGEPGTDEVVVIDETAEAVDEGSFADSTPLAVAASLLPQARPDNIDAIVAAAERVAPEADAPAVETAAIAPGPRIPTAASVAEAATQDGVLRLRNLNLIGVVGTASDRNAMVRLPNGRIVQVGVGDALDGGTVAAIGATTLQYVRRGRTLTLEIPG